MRKWYVFRIPRNTIQILITVFGAKNSWMSLPPPSTRTSYKVFRTSLKDQVRHYAMHLPDGETLSSLGRDRFLWLHDRHWQIEQYHRAIKQVCHVEHFQVRTPAAIQNHIFAAICGYAQLQRLCIMDVLKNCYQVQRTLFNGVVAEFVRTFMSGKEYLNPQFHAAVNA